MQPAAAAHPAIARAHWQCMQLQRADAVHVPPWPIATLIRLVPLAPGKPLSLWEATLWSAVTSECEQTLEGHTSYVTSAQFGPDGQKIVSAGDDSSHSTVRVWSALTGECE